MGHVMLGRFRRRPDPPAPPALGSNARSALGPEARAFAAIETSHPRRPVSNMAAAAAAAALPSQRAADRAREVVAFIREERERAIAAGKGDPGIYWTYFEMRQWVYDYARELKHPTTTDGEPPRPMPDHVAGFLELLAETVHDDEHHDELDGWNITAIVNAIRLVPGVSATTQPVRYLSKPQFAQIRARYAVRYGCDSAGRPYCGQRNGDGLPYAAEKFNIFTIRAAVTVADPAATRSVRSDSATRPSAGRSGAVDDPADVARRARTEAAIVRTPGGLRGGSGPDSGAGAESDQRVSASGHDPAEHPAGFASRRVASG